MAGNTTALNFALTATDRASDAFNDVGRASTRAAGQFSKLKVAGGLAIAAVATAAAKFGVDSVKAFSESEDAQKQLAFAFKKFPALANSSQAAMQKLNSELQKKTKFDDDNIASGQAVLANFKLTGKQIEGVTPLLLDYADKMGKDVPGAAKDVGKALLGNAKALKNIGISYKSTGDASKDFANITALMRSKIGGFAESEATTAAGKAAILKNQFGELQEKVGGYLVPALTKLTGVGLKVVGWINDKAVPAVVAFAGKIKANVTPTLTRLSDWFTTVGLPALKGFAAWVGAQLQPKIQALGDVISTKVVPALQTAGAWVSSTGIPALASFGGWVQKNADWLKSVGVAVLAVVGALKIYNATMAIWRGIQTAAIALQTAWNVVMALNPIGAIALAIVGLIAGLTYFFTKTGTGKKIWAGFTHALSAGWVVIKGAFAKGWSAVSGFMGKVWDVIKKVWSFSPLGLVVNNFGKIVGFIKSLPGKIMSGLSSVIGFFKKVFGYSPIGLLVNNFGKVISFIKGIPGKITSGLGDLKSLLLSAGGHVIDGLVNGIKGALHKVVDAAKSIVSSISSPVKKLLGIHSPSRVFHGFGKNVVEGLIKGLESMSGKLGKAVERMVAKVTASKDELKGLLDARAQMKSGVAGGITGALDLAGGVGQDSTDENGYTVKGKTTFASVAGRVSSLAAKAKAFAGKLSRMVKVGIPAGLVQQVAGMGIDDGSTVADAFLSGTAKDIRGLQQSWAALNAYAGAAGNSVAGQQYDRGIAAQRKQVARDEKALARVRLAKEDIDDLAKALAREMKANPGKLEAHLSIDKRESAHLVKVGLNELRRNP